MTRAVLSIGSNLGDPLVHLQSAVDGLGSRVVAVSGVYRTAPWGGVEQQDFLNAIVIATDPGLDCMDWLHLGQRLEAAADRTREVRWGPRTLDVDVITCDTEVRTDATLTLPHPRAHERAFVLVPWLDVDPDATLEVAGTRTAVRDLLAGLDPAERDGVHPTDLALRA
ncbi:2-amino-4-hydroxy-6-hydroxymethyldihydropteridine diphosphokinase [Aldersonia kunmingensis]|uniref:2-amino-4-hydroxy-6- hydroxymethyldihydropteridine diphosphokinase n=1 Tax=Aldersonia kunmingensis TaxID=408066 RepID=UPI00082D7910|nr:2-amino-4-hydroxy-6-hydroxymethyldihydropteridine diphosphokinase [Aldersonia kunmingensis]